MERFFLRKMVHEGAPELQYSLGEIAINSFVGQTISISATGKKECVSCGRGIKKTFSQGYCFPCFRDLARCDTCIVKPELCHFHEGTCREPEWGQTHCLIDHVVYLANTTGLKVGVTGAHKLFERWGDQGAVEAVLLAKVPERKIAGLIEVALKEHVNDRTDWRGLLKGKFGESDLLEEKVRLAEFIPEEFQEFIVRGGEHDTVHSFTYPVEEYLEKASTANFDKTPEVCGVLSGIRGQYLFIGGRALNIRKFAGYEVEFSSSL